MQIGLYRHATGQRRWWHAAHRKKVSTSVWRNIQISILYKHLQTHMEVKPVCVYVREILLSLASPTHAMFFASGRPCMMPFCHAATRYVHLGHWPSLPGMTQQMARQLAVRRSRLWTADLCSLYMDLPFHHGYASQHRRHAFHLLFVLVNSPGMFVSSSSSSSASRAFTLGTPIAWSEVLCERM